MKNQINRTKIRERLKAVDLVICDMDGTLRRCTVKGRNTPYRPGEWELMPHVRETFALVDWTQIRIAVATNQPDVAEGKVSLRMARALIHDALDEAGVPSGRPICGDLSPSETRGLRMRQTAAGDARTTS
jgi:histidinol phosphatase-like enzyme